MGLSGSDEQYPMKRLPTKRAGREQKGEPPSEDSRYNEDEAHLARFGRKQQLRRNFNLVSIFLQPKSCRFERLSQESSVRNVMLCRDP